MELASIASLRDSISSDNDGKTLSEIQNISAVTEVAPLIHVPPLDERHKESTSVTRHHSQTIC